MSRRFLTPSDSLAVILTRHFGHPISAGEAKSLICDHWSKISVLAHEIHDAITAVEERNDALEKAARLMDAADSNKAAQIRGMKA